MHLNGFMSGFEQSATQPEMQPKEVVEFVTTNCNATVEYEIAPLPDGRHAIRWSLCYESGNMSGHASPWSAYENREACVDAFLSVAKRHFQAEIIEHKLFESQWIARKQMLALLNGGLFGFVEPEPERDSQ